MDALPETGVGVAGLAGSVIGEVERAVVGKRPVLEQMMAAILAGGHLLLEDFPGLAKTLIANSFATALGLEFRRIQFTPDLLPGDITGGYVYDRVQSRFSLRRGPLVANIILADEINRASPKTQSALLEAMQEYQVTLEGETLPLPEPFIVFATQNPIEYEGTFPLPEAQLDRFLLRVSLGYVSKRDEIQMIEHQQFQHPIAALAAVVSQAEVVAMQEAVKHVFVSDAIKQYIVDLTFATRDSDSVYLGSSPRGSLGLFRAGQALAPIRGRDFVLPDDVKAVIEPVLVHRIIVNPSARLKLVSPKQIIADIVQRVPVPEAKG